MPIFGLLLGAAAIGGPLGALIARARRRAREVDGQSTTRPVAFTIAAIALAAKMARADGAATEQEFATFERLFVVAPAERANAARFYRLAKASTAGFEAYADQAAALLGRGSPALADLLDALLAIAAVDGFDGAELDYFDRVAARLGFGPAEIAAIKARHLAHPEDDPFAVLGIAPDADRAAVREAYRRLAREHHPDRHLADGVPPEFIRVAEARMAAINAAYAALARVT